MLFYISSFISKSFVEISTAVDRMGGGYKELTNASKNDAVNTDAAADFHRKRFCLTYSATIAFTWTR